MGIPIFPRGGGDCAHGCLEPGRNPGSPGPPDRVKLGRDERRAAMLMEEEPGKPASASRMTLAIITQPGQANAFGTLHGGVLLRLADECGAISALRHVGR